MMHMDHSCRLIAIIQRCIWAPLAVIMYLGQLSKDGPKDPKKGLKGLPALAGTKRGGTSD